MSQPPASDSGSSVPDFLAIPPEPRRGFVKQFLAFVIGGLVGLVPAVVGLATFLNPLRKSVKEKQRPIGSDAEGFYRVTALNSLSEIPQAFKIIADRKDAWNVYPKDSIGAVFLQRVGAEEVRAFNVSCPHAGCSVSFRAARSEYHCPCHNSTFGMDGKRDPSSPSPRDLDDLAVKVDNGEVLVKYQKFKAGTDEKKAV
jgi:menaquinol-cytochrome c reductase iron-sulfur subunit